MNNTDEPLLQLDFDETNRHHQHRSNHNSSQLISIDFKQPLRHQHQQALQQPDSVTFVQLQQHQNSHQFDLDNCDQVDSNGDYDQHRHLLLTNECGDANGDVNDNNDTIKRHSPTNASHLLTVDRHSLISLSSNSSELDGIVNVNAIDANVIANRDSSLDTASLLHPDDTVEVNLLADTSMDSRESQPLLGMGRDAHDFVHNNFPGKFQPIRIRIHLVCNRNFELIAVSRRQSTFALYIILIKLLSSGA